MADDLVERVAMEYLQKRAKEYLDIAAHIGGCGDGGCVILRPKGMHTNGGCRCPRDMDARQIVLLKGLLRKGQHIAAAIRAMVKD